MKHFITFLILIMNIVPAYSTEWINIGTNLLLDKESVKYVSKNRTYKAWIKETKPTEVVLYLNEYNLKENIWRNLDTVIMDFQNNIKRREIGNNLGLQWVNVVPDTNSYYEYDAVKRQSKINPEILEKELHID